MLPSNARRRTVVLCAATAVVSSTLVGGVAVAAGERPLRPTETRQNLPAGQSNPAIASGTSIGGLVSMYKSSGTGPGGLNPTAPAGTPARYIDAGDFPGGALPAGVTLTEAQGLNALERIGENLASVGLSYDDVITMRVFVDNEPGTEVADYAGFNRAYRQYFANIDLVSGDTVPVPLGSAPPAPPIVANDARPSRALLEVASLPVAGWLVEIEVDAPLPRR